MRFHVTRGSTGMRLLETICNQLSNSLDLVEDLRRKFEVSGPAARELQLALCAVEENTKVLLERYGHMLNGGRL